MTDPMLFDIVEPRHPCNEKVSVVADIGLRLSTSFFKVVEGVRDRWQRSTPNAPATAVPATPVTARPVSINSKEVSEEPELGDKSDTDSLESFSTFLHPSLLKRDSTASGMLSSSDQTLGLPSAVRLSLWGAGIGSFMSSRVGRFSLSKSPSATPVPAPPALPLTPPPASNALVMDPSNSSETFI
ncbi:hypothetical protein BDP27DRAFT_1440699 [Rhodocollybia butyracea]|uniref:Uncharacterized protein n=1 Tax=Rhodocollybia butyracea TaxID=206335 RepID=A0A9P5TUA2_9AGAR|nr:hypothetical protein BDP27DRAFT_1440699 [Rhodocollybia butyracea]